MDEVIFRSSQKLENFQVQLSLAVSQSKDLLHAYSTYSKSALIGAWNSSYSIQLKTQLAHLLAHLAAIGDKLRDRLWLQIDLERLYYNLVKVFWKKWTKRDVYFLGTGFICGGLVGVLIAFKLRKKDSPVRYMQAVQCVNYLGIESATVIENALAPFECGQNEVLINVKAASVNLVDVKICSGYGRTLRSILQRIYCHSYSGDLPVTLGRDCTGVVTDVGEKVRRVDIGDEVWLTVPFWAKGTLSQSFLISELQIGRKPKNIGFEGACSLPYSGTIALNALKSIDLSETNAQFKRVLIVGACTPVGCVLVQILKHWNATITATCYKRATPVAKALGVSDLIMFPDQIDNDTFKKELEMRDPFDFVILTRECGLHVGDFKEFCQGCVVSTLPKEICSDNYGCFTKLVLGKFIHFKYLVEKLFGISSEYDEAHMCYMTLDGLVEMVENGKLQTVVDKVFHPEDIEIALNHIQSPESIGSTVITFR